MSENATIEAVAQAVHDLSESVIELKAGLVDQTKVEQTVLALLEAQKAHAVEANQARGITAEDAGAAEHAWASARTRLERITALHERPAEVVATLARRPPGDVCQFQTVSDDLLILSTMMRCDPRETDFYAQEYLPALRAAMDSTTAAEGDEWVPTELSSMFITRVNLPLKVAALFATIAMPTQPYDLPAAPVARIRTGIHSEQTADTGQTKFKAITPGTRKVQLSAIKFAGRVLVSREVEEDSLVPILPMVQSELTEYIAADLEDAIINGDTTTTHFDSDVTESDDVRKFWNGLRDIAINGQTGTDVDGTDIKLAVANLRTNRKLMGKYGADPTKLAHIVSVRGGIDLLDDSSVITLEKYGPAATILSGELGKVDGSPVIMSEYVSDFQNASGVIDEVTETQTSAITVHTGGFLRGVRRGFTVEVLREVYAEADQDAVIASIRQAFSARYPLTENIVALTYNLPGSA